MHTIVNNEILQNNNNNMQIRQNNGKIINNELLLSFVGLIVIRGSNQWNYFVYKNYFPYEMSDFMFWLQFLWNFRQPWILYGMKRFQTHTVCLPCNEFLKTQDRILYQHSKISINLNTQHLIMSFKLLNF